MASFGRVIGTVKNVTYEYRFEAIPFMSLLKNEVRNREYGSAQPIQTSPTSRETTFGAGLIPLSFRLYFLPPHRVKPFFHGGTGMIFTNKPIPVPDATNYNFVGYFGGGVLVHLSRTKVVTFSYRFFHISNGSTGKINPGYNANVFAVGYSFFRK